jgi:hypothetical protein
VTSISSPPAEISVTLAASHFSVNRPSTPGQAGAYEGTGHATMKPATSTPPATAVLT